MHQNFHLPIITQRFHKETNTLLSPPFLLFVYCCFTAAGCDGRNSSLLELWITLKITICTKTPTYNIFHYAFIKKQTHTGHQHSVCSYCCFYSFFFSRAWQLWNHNRKHTFHNIVVLFCQRFHNYVISWLCFLLYSDFVFFSKLFWENVCSLELGRVHTSWENQNTMSTTSGDDRISKVEVDVDTFFDVFNVIFWYHILVRLLRTHKSVTVMTYWLDFYEHIKVSLFIVWGVT
jgi:hypothetical protein